MGYFITTPIYYVNPSPPATSERIAATFGVGADELAHWQWGVAADRVVVKLEPLFPRLEVTAS